MNLRLENLYYRVGSHRFHYQAVLDSGITGVFGPSGSGKTTLMNLIGGLTTPESGRMVFQETVFFDGSTQINVPANRRNIGMVFQANDLFPHLTVRQNLLYSAPYIKAKKAYIGFDTLVRLLDLPPFLDKRPGQLSGGERQRVAIGRALLSQPGLLLLDEPFSNLDRQRREQIIAYLLKINSEFHVPLLIISHDLEDILKLTTALLVVQDGRITAQGSHFKIAESGAAPEIISPRNHLNIFELHYLPQAVEGTLHGFGLTAKGRLPLLKLTSGKLPQTLVPGQRVRFCIEPDDIALTLLPIPDISIRNQLEGTIEKMVFLNGSCFVTVDCGIRLVAAITAAAAEKLALQTGQRVYCLVKSKAIEVIYVYEENREVNLT